MLLMAAPHPHVHDDPAAFRYCPKCGGDLAQRLLKPGEPSRKVCQRCEYIFYLDPKVAAGTLCTLNQRLLLVKRGIEPGYGKWVFPGGYVDRGETVEAAAIREAREEANVAVRLDRLLNVYSYPGRSVIVIVFVGTVVGGDPRPGDETLAVNTFASHDIPWEDLAFPSTRDALKEYVSL